MSEEEPIQLKLVIIGDGAVGKTCLLLTYINKGFPQKYNPTVVDNYQAKLKVGNRQVHLDVWDTAGQEDFESIRTLSYPGTNCILACYSTVSKTSLENINNVWIPEMRNTLPHTPFVLVGTKADLMDKMRAMAVQPEDAEEVKKKLKGYESVQCSAMWYQDRAKSKVDKAFKSAISGALNHMNFTPSPCCTLL